MEEETGEAMEDDNTASGVTTISGSTNISSGHHHQVSTPIDTESSRSEAGHSHEKGSGKYGTLSSASDTSSSQQRSVTVPPATSITAADRELLNTDDSKLTREERHLKRYIESFIRMEERQRKAAAAATGGGSTKVEKIEEPKRSGKGGSSVSSTSSLSSGTMASSSHVSTSDIGGDGPDGNIDPRLIRMRQRDRAREESLRTLDDIMSGESDEGRPMTPPHIGPIRSIHPESWTNRRLFPRSDAYLAKKYYLLSSLQVRPGAFPTEFIYAQDTMPLAKRLALCHPVINHGNTPIPVPSNPSLNEMPTTSTTMTNNDNNSAP